MKQNLEERLRAHSGLYERISKLLEVVENSAGDVNQAAEAERRVIEELRQLGQEALQGWAERRQEVVEQAAESDSALSRKEKKDSTGTPATGKFRESSRPIVAVVAAAKSAPLSKEGRFAVENIRNLSSAC
jgi:hypothetical protein